MKPIIKWTLWQRRWSILWWSLGIFGFIFINMIFYPTFKDQAAELQKSFESLPETAVQLFGGSTDFFSPVGFLNSQIFFILLPLILGILAISLGAGLLAKEEQDKTIEMLLARPISRSRLLAAKALTGVIVLILITFVGLITTIATAAIVKLNISTMAIIWTTVACFILVLSFGAVAFLISATGRARNASIGIASLIALGGYLISSLAGTVKWLSAPSKVFPFHYYKSEELLRGIYQWENITFLVVLIVLCAALSWLSFRRRDI